MKTLLTACVAAACALAQQPKIQNAKLETRTVSGGLESTMNGILSSQTSPVWVGYAEPIVKGDRNMCCYNNGSYGCFLEGRYGDGVVVSNEARTVKLEGPTHLVILFRVEDHQIGKTRTSTPECDLDAGGLPFIWLEGVQPADSIHYLTGLATKLAKHGGVVSAIALHNDPAADTALDQLAAQNQPESLRRDAVFWMGSARGGHGYQALLRILHDDPSDKVREHAVFAMSESKEPGAIDAVIKVAHDDKSTHVRGQALFWLAQKAGQKAAATIENAIQNDPETEVKKKAVFALSQIPHGDGVPLLIQVAQTNRNPEVRKQAMFWLGQSKDPRALAFIEQVLSR
ncbi:MAG TPA: HEAT repeat domain-containing protein [Bryobacteraceae bacterium]|nr:HEAT repeat domain-containing protein [Bryobacteraceae bacterium]